MQSQLVCSGCRSVLLYPRGAANVCCAICNTITAPTVPPPGMDMSQLTCGGCRILLMYTRGATSVRCSCCHTINLARPPAPAPNQVAHVNCGRCNITLMYPYGAPSVKCAVCQYVTNMMSAPIPNSSRPNWTPTPMPSTSARSEDVIDWGIIIACLDTETLLTSASPEAEVDSRSQKQKDFASEKAMRTHGQTVVVENPMSVDESGKLVTNVVVGVTSGKK